MALGRGFKAIPKAGPSQVISIGLMGRAEFYREALREYLNRHPSFAVTDLGREGQDAIDRARHVQPDVLLIDLPPTEIVSVAAALQVESVDSRILAVLSVETDDDVVQLAEAGVAGFIAITATFEEFFHEIHSALRNELECSPRMAAALLRGLGKRGSAGEASAAGLTGRECQIVRMLEQGLSNKEVAVALRIETGTVKNHVHSILTKLGLHTRWDLGHRRGEQALPLRLVDEKADRRGRN